MKVTFDEKFCKGCLLCVEACPKKVLEVNKEYVNHKGYNPIHCIDDEKCISCAMCATICPDSVIKVEKVEREKE